MTDSCDIHRIIEEGRVCAHFQPIVSLKTAGITGYEGLIRGIHTGSTNLITPEKLFDAASQQGCTVRLDRLCRDTILKTFACDILPVEPHALLFINFESSIIDAGIVGSNHILDIVDRTGIPYQNIVLEIIESKVYDTGRLKEFVNAYRARGFLFALDDIGAGHSNLDRIALVAPDILKIDRALCAGISTSDIHRKIFNALTQLGHSIGTLVLAEGVEDEADVLLAAELGADLQQGFYFSRPGYFKALDTQHCLAAINHAGILFKQKKLDTARQLAGKYIERERTINDLLCVLENCPVEQYDRALASEINAIPGCECVYIINRQGIQVSDTICADSACRRPEHHFPFHPASRGTDHSFKDYSFITACSPAGRFVSDNYISMATGSLCRTAAYSFCNGGMILCADITDLL